MKIKSAASLIVTTLITTFGLLSGQGFAAQPDAAAERPEMGFFVTSRGIGNGGNLGGLAGADAHCQALATEPQNPKTPKIMEEGWWMDVNRCELYIEA